MAIKDCKEISNIIAMGVIAGDDNLAKKLAELSEKKKRNELKTTFGATASKAKAADIEMASLVYDRVLSGDVRASVRVDLIKSMKQQGGSVYNGLTLMDMLNNASPVDYGEIARLWGYSGDESIKAVNDIKKKLSSYTSSTFSIRNTIGFGDTEGIGKLKKKFRKGEITLDEYKKQAKQLSDEAFYKTKEAKKELEKKAKKKKDMVKSFQELEDRGIPTQDLENPTGFAKLDGEWQTIKKISNWDEEEALNKWGQYVIARELIASGATDDDMLKALVEGMDWVKVENLVGELTRDQIDNCKTLEELMSRAFINTKDLVNDEMLRMLYGKKLVELASGGGLDIDDVDKVMKLVNNSKKFVEYGGNFSDVLKYNTVVNSLTDMGYKVNISGKTLYNEFIDVCKGLDLKNIPSKIELGGMKVGTRDFLNLMYDITGDINLLKLVDAGVLDDKTIIGFATKSLLGESAVPKLNKLFAKASKRSKIDNPLNLIIKTLTGVDIGEGSKVKFFDYKHGLYTANEEALSKSRYMDMQMNRNRMAISGVEAIDPVNATEESIEKELKTLIGSDGGYLIVNDVNWRQNDKLNNALQRVNEGLNDDMKIKVISPNKALMTSFIYEDGKLIFRTKHDGLFNTLSSRIAFQSLGEARPTREMVAEALEATTGRNSDKIRYQITYNEGAVDNLGNKLSDQQAEHFQYSKARDENGNLIVVYHGTDNLFEEFDITKLSNFCEGPGMYFADDISYAKGYGNSVLKCYINITNPLEFRTEDMSHFEKILSGDTIKRFATVLNEKGLLTDEGLYAVEYRLSRIEGGASKSLECREAFEKTWQKVQGTPEMSEYLKTFTDITGYDGIHVVKDLTSKYSEKADFWIAFSENQMKFTDNLQPSLSRNMKYELVGHASPYKYDAYDKSKNLTQVYGFGIYTSEDIRMTMSKYGKFPKDKLEPTLFRGEPLYDGYSDDKYIARELYRLISDGMTFNDAKKHIIDLVKESGEEDKQWIIDTLNGINKNDFSGKGNLYLYEIDEGGRWIDWDKQISDSDYKEIQFGLNKEQLDKFNSYTESNKTGKSVYQALSWSIGGQEKASKYLSGKGFLGNKYVGETGKNNFVIFNTDSEFADRISYQLADSYPSNLLFEQATRDESLKLEIFVNTPEGIRTVEDVANAYGIKIKNVVGPILTPEGLKAYGAYGDGIIYLSDAILDGTAAHEVFHAVFDMVNPETYNKILDDGVKLFGIGRGDVEEQLADAFAHYIKTGEILLSENFKSKNRGPIKGLLNKVREFFENVKAWIEGAKQYDSECKKLFDDIVNVKVTPMNGEYIDQAKAAMKYNNTLNDVAYKYFGDMLGVTGESTSEEYIKKVQGLLSDKTGIPLKSFNDIEDKGKLFQMVDERLTLDNLVTGKYDTEFINIQEEFAKIDMLDNSKLAECIVSDLKGIVDESKITSSGRINEIRDTYKDLRTATNAIEYLQAKGKLISIINGGNPATLSMQDLKNMFTNGRFESKYKDMFFPNQELKEDEVNKFIDAINDNIFDMLSIQFANNAVKAGMSLPMVNVKGIIYDYLTNSLDLNSPFAEAFLYKNGIPFTRESLQSTIQQLMPSSIVFDYSNAGYKSNIDKVGDISVLREHNNIFVTDSYSALASIDAVKSGLTLKGDEKKILTDILDKYIEKVNEGLNNGTLTFAKAQALKQDCGYALDMFEQDYLIPKYGRMLTRQEKQQLMGMKYQLPIAVNGASLADTIKELERTKDNLLKGYDDILTNKVEDNDINKLIYEGGHSPDKYIQKKLEKRTKQLAEQGAVIQKVGDEYVVYDCKDQLMRTLATLPGNIRGVNWLKSASKEMIDEIPNEQAYAILRTLEAAKALNSKANLVTDLMYKQDPRLSKLNFFDSFAINPDTGLPKIMNTNGLTYVKELSKLNNLDAFDTEVKKQIFDKVKKHFSGKKGYITSAELEKEIRGVLNDNVVNLGNNLGGLSEKKFVDIATTAYTNTFNPYTYLRDIPTGGTLEDGTKLVNVKGRLDDIIRKQYTQAKADISSLSNKEYDELLDLITIATDDGTELKLRDLGEASIDNWKKNIFGNEDAYVRQADELTDAELSDGKVLTDKERKNLVSEEKEKRKNVNNQYNGVLQAIENQTQIISEGDALLQTSILKDVRAKLRRNSLTNIISDTTDKFLGINEEVAKGLKHYLLGAKYMFSLGFAAKDGVMERLRLVKEAYSKYYYMNIDDFRRAKPTNEAEKLAYDMTNYFKQLENSLGSVDGATGCTTRADINMAFNNIGEVFLNIREPEGIMGIMSAIEQNQLLKFFKFSKSGQKSYVKEFMNNLTDTGGFVYRDYAQDIISLNRDEFNAIFGSNYNDSDFKQIMQALSGYTIYGNRFVKSILKKLDFVNSSNMLFRMAMSYPGQLFTIPQQGFAYFLKQMGFEKMVGVESLNASDTVRERHGILNGAFNEFNITKRFTANPDDLNPMSYYNRYGIPDTGRVYKNTEIYASDTVDDIYTKIDIEGATDTVRWASEISPYKDNANNIVDGVFSRNFKNIAFVKALKENDYIKFATAKEFDDFMTNPNISQEIKDKVLDRVQTYSGRNFRNILGLGFGGIDRPMGGGPLGNIMMGVINMLNFRGAWGQNIFKQTGEAIYSAFRMYKSGVDIDTVMKYIENNPEFLNFVQSLWNDLLWSWRLNRYQDNGRYPEEDNVYSILDYVEFMTESMNATSQWLQGLNSYGPIRPAIKGGVSFVQHIQDPTIYKDTFGAGAFINALSSNFGRQWKPVNWIAKAIGAYEDYGWEGAMAYIDNEWMKLSFGTMRYMMTEDESGYGYTYELTGEYGGIPSILMGESNSGTDKQFLYDMNNNETYQSLIEMFDGDNTIDERKTYRHNFWTTVINSSQLASSSKNIRKLANKALGISDDKFTSPFTSDDFQEIVQHSEAGRELYLKGYSTPKDGNEAVKFFKIMSSRGKYRPGSKSFIKSIENFETYGNMAGETANSADADMEFWLTKMKYDTSVDGTTNMNKVTDDWKYLMSVIKTYGYNQTMTSDFIYKFSVDWINKHNSDPNVMLYNKLLGEGYVNNIIDNMMSDFTDLMNIGKKGTADKKWSESESINAWKPDMLLLMGNSKFPGEDKTYFQKIADLDTDGAVKASIAIISKQLAGTEDATKLDNFFSIKENGDDIDIKLTGKYNSQITQMANMARALDEGNIERFLAEASNVSNRYFKDDPTGVIRTEFIDSLNNRIYQSKALTPAQKIETMAALFHHNKDFVTKNAEQIKEKSGEDYDTYQSYMNGIIHRWDSEVISTLESLQTSGDTSESGKKAVGTAKGLSSAFKEAALNFGDGSGNPNYRGDSIKAPTFVPVRIAGANLIKELGTSGYVPSKAKISINAYTPNSKFDIKKDTNRNYKTTKTQEVKKSKQLSSIESKAQKAIESES